MVGQILLQTEDKMKKTMEHLRLELMMLKTGRATPTILDIVKVRYYDSDLPVNQVASISIPEPRLIVITPWEKGVLPEIEKAILKADIGITPQNDGKVIRLPIPALTEERRKDIIKTAKKITEDHKVEMRNERRDSQELIKKSFNDKKMTEDEKYKLQEELQKMTESYIKKLDEMLLIKEKEIMTV
ncbi:MAG: ribosome recycling factor [Elusimicrobia bacterium RIFOXYC2_FULL_34_12]|nr:MAG: ribosome recycling factor [Elusimicrobia bacterium RIFOXYC2_FULL_34_12]OGS39045.1 MAG: ribosome recycling factor [Elusimicrobia bacterium RIFOXYD2_FULL_34_30]HAM39708.1 ribosome recycling factor [Elusimicrobiota bacterium]